MKYKNTVITERDSLQLVKSVSERGNVKYLIKLTGWKYRATHLQAIFDPVGNRCVSSGTYEIWKFNNKREAEEAMAVAILRGSDQRL